MSAAILQFNSSIPELRQQVDQVLQEIWEPPYDGAPNNDDQLLLLAASELRRLISRERVLELAAIRILRCTPAASRAIEREANRLTRRRDRLCDFLFESKAVGLAGARVKLQILCEPSIGILDQLVPAQAAGMRDLIRVIAREMKWRSRKLPESADARRLTRMRKKKLASSQQSHPALVEEELPKLSCARRSATPAHSKRKRC